MKTLLAAIVLAAVCSTSVGANAGTAPDWTNPNVPFRFPIFEPAHYPKWTDADAVWTPGTPAACDPKTFIPTFAKGDALNDFFASPLNSANEPPFVLKDFYNGHPIGFPTGNVLFPVGVGKVKAYQGDGARRLQDMFMYMVSKSPSVEDIGTYQACTSYFNNANKDAEEAFQWIPIPVDMKGKTTDPKRVAEAAAFFARSFSTMLPRLIDCEEKFGYFAFGCQSAFERGPTLLGMVLKELGCSTANSVFIADMLQGRNDIPLSTRKAIVDQTPIDPLAQKALQALFFGTP